MKLKILHLSDLHFREDNIPQDVVISSLTKAIEHICENEGKPNLVIITGDIAFSGKEEEYKLAKQFIDNLLRLCSIDENRLFLIPGNHDVSRNKLLRIHKSLYDFKVEDDLSDLFNTPAIFTEIKKTTEVYYRYAQSSMGKGVSFGKYGEYVSEVPIDEANGLQLKIVGLNSALFCGYDGDDKGKIAIGLQQVEPCYKNIDKKKEIVISCVHHPFMGGCYFNFESPALNLVKRNSDFILTGHVHDPSRTFQSDGAGTNTHLIAAGAAFEKRTSENGFNLIEINTSDLTGMARSYKYMSKAHEWIPNKDLNHDTDGRYYFTLAKESKPAAKAAGKKSVRTTKKNPGATLLPVQPAFYAKPSYPTSHKFVGRQAELEVLDEWARPINNHPILLFEALGGTGKSMLTWEWAKNHAEKIRNDWKGIFWYSFYEKGAVMDDFCQHALAYITRKPLEHYREKKVGAMAEELIAELNKNAWLLILDGLERVLEEYKNNRWAEDKLSDDDRAIDAERKPSECVHTADAALLNDFLAVDNSKILISTRLVPRNFLNNAHQFKEGIQHYLLRGLHPADAEKMFRNSGISGDAKNIQDYLLENCGCHPLTIGALAGVVKDFLPDRGNFDEWVKSPIGAGQLDFTDLNLEQRQNHILKVAVSNLPKESKQLLKTMSLYFNAMDYAMLIELNPYLGPEPEEVEKPYNPESSWQWKDLNEDEKKQRKSRYQIKLENWQSYSLKKQEWITQKGSKEITEKLQKTVLDIEERGLLQYDSNSKRYDLHPVVRRVVADGLDDTETNQFGQPIVNYLIEKTHIPYEEVKTFIDVSDGIHLVRTLLRMKRYEEAFDIYNTDLSNALFFNLECYEQILTLLRPYFLNGYSSMPKSLEFFNATRIVNDVALALDLCEKVEETQALWDLLIKIDIEAERLSALRTGLTNYSVNQSDLLKYANQEKLIKLASSVAVFAGDVDIFLCYLFHFDFLVKIGLYAQAGEFWNLLNPMGRDWNRSAYRPGSAEFDYCLYQFYKDELTLNQIKEAMLLAQEGNNSIRIRDLNRLKGDFHLSKKEWRLAKEAFTEAVHLAKTHSLQDYKSEIYLALAKIHLGELDDASAEAERLSEVKKPEDLALAELWLAIGDKQKAAAHGLAAYKTAWSDGEPYVHRFHLNKAISLLTQAGIPIPNLAPYNPATRVKFAWEDDLLALIEKMKAEEDE